ncbi:hypothetical protein L7F22_059433 [Adiantum nelumboides]|nr:hypothetical protein [Adiantum nelumboides]
MLSILSPDVSKQYMDSWWIQISEEITEKEKFQAFLTVVGLLLRCVDELFNKNLHPLPDFSTLWGCGCPSAITPYSTAHPPSYRRREVTDDVKLEGTESRTYVCRKEDAVDMSGPPPPPPPFPPTVEWHPSSGFQSDYDSVPPPPGVSSAPVTFGFSRSPAPALADQIPALWSPGVGAGLFRQVTPSQATFLNPNSSSHCWPITPNIQSSGVMPGIYLQQTFVSQAPPKLAGYGSQSYCYGTPSTSVAHNATVSHVCSNTPYMQNPFPAQPPSVGSGSMHGDAVSQPTNFDKIDLKELIPTLRGLIAQVNESVRKIVSMVKIKPDTLPLKNLDPQFVGSTKERMATHSIMEDCLDHRASSVSLKRSDELTTASTIFNNIMTFSRKSRDNPFYKDAPGIVQVPVYANDESFESSKLPEFAMGERWDELTLENFGADREVQGTLLPSRYWLVSKEIAEWTVLPKKLTSYQLKALAGLPLVQRADLKKWLLTHGRSYGVLCSSSLADHIVFLLVFCLRAVHREATPLIDSSEKLALVDCRTLHQTASWLSIQLSLAYDAACCANLVLDLFKYALKMAAYCSVSPVRRSGPEGVQKEESIKVGAGLEQEPHYHPCPSSEACTDLSKQSSCVGDGVLCLQHLAAAILAIHAQAVDKTCTASDLLTCLPNQRSAVHTMVTNKAAEVRATRADYRAVLEHDGLMWQRPQNQLIHDTLVWPTVRYTLNQSWFEKMISRMDGYKEEGSSSQDRQSNPTVHEVGEGSSQAEEGFPHAAFSITGTASPGTLFGGMQSMVPNPMYANIGLHPGFQGTQVQFGVSQGNLGMAGFSIPPVNMTPRHQHVTGQGVQMAPTGKEQNVEDRLTNIGELSLEIRGDRLSC